MSVVSVTSKWEDRGGFDARTASEFTVPYQVETDNGLDGPAVVLADVRIPRVGDTYMENGIVLPNLTVSKRSPRSIGPMFWEVDVVYATGATGGGFLNLHPLQRPSIRSFGFVPVEEVVDRDIYGRPIVTRNNEVFRDLRETFFDQRIQVTRNEAAIDLTLHRAYANVINSDTFGGAEPGVCMMRPIESYEQREDWQNTVVNYFVTRYTIDVREPIEGTAIPRNRVWWRNLLHRGYLVRQQVGTESKIVHAKDDAGNLVTEPVLLDSEGYQTDANNPLWLSFQTRPEKPFGIWGL